MTNNKKWSLLASFAVLTVALGFFQNCKIVKNNSSGAGPTAASVNAPIILSPGIPVLVSKLNTLTISGTCDPAGTIHLGGAIAAADVTTPSGSLAQACTGGTFSYTIEKTTDGVYQFEFTQDIGGLFSINSAVFIWQRDTVAPNALTLSSPGLNPFFSSAQDDSLLIQGTCETTNTVTLSGNATATALCIGSSFSFTVNQPVGSPNDFTFALKQTDLAGNSSGVTTLQWERQDLPPTPTITSPAASPLHNNSDTVVVSGACMNGYTVALGGADSQTAVCSSSSYSFNVSKLADGIYNFSVTQTNNIAQVSGAASAQWIRDTVKPAAPTITSPGASPYLSAASNIALTGTCEPDATVSLTLSGSAAVSQLCLPLGEYLFLISAPADGTFDYAIDQTDLAGNKSDAAAFSFIRDTTVPSTPVISLPTQSSHSSNTDGFSLKGSCIPSLTVTLAGDDSQTQTCDGMGTFSFDILKTAANGTETAYAFTVLQTSATGIQSGSAVHNWNQDKIAPSQPGISNPAAASMESSGSTLAVEGDCESGAAVSLMGDDSQSAVCVNSAFSFTVSKTQDGTYSFNVSQTDAAGNSSPASTVQWIRNSVAPFTPVILTPASAVVYSALANLTVSGTCGQGNTVHLNGDLGAQNMVCDPGNGFSFNLNSIQDGDFQISISQTHADLTSGAAGVLWKLDRVAPDTNILSGPNANISIGYVTVKFDSNEPSTFKCKLNSGIYLPCTSGKSYILLNSGTHTIYVSATDLAGNTDQTPASVTFIVDRSAPDINFSSYPSPFSNSTSATFAFSADDVGSTFECKLDGGSYSACVSPHTLSSLSSGDHKFTVRAKNLAGSISTKSISWEVDTLSPNTIVTGPENTTKNWIKLILDSSDSSVRLFDCTNVNPGPVSSASWHPCPLDSAHGGKYEATISGVPQGCDNKVYIRARDAAGNVDPTPFEFKFSYSHRSCH